MEHNPLTASYDLPPFVGTPDTDGSVPSAGPDDPPLADSAVLPDATLVGQLKASQQDMIRLNDAIPRPSNVMRQHLDYWFRKTFPALADSVTVHELSVRTLREETIPPAQRTADGPAIRKTVADILFLETLLLQAVAGRIDPSAFFHDLDDIEIVTHRDNATVAPVALNERAVKTEIKRLINTTPALYERLLTRALDEFWNNPASFSQARNVGDWLVDELAGQLKAQADLHRLDTTLSPPMHKALTDYALSAPDAASRAKLAERVRPGVFSLAITPRRWSFSVPVSGAVALSRHDNASDPGAAVLYRPGQPLQMYETLQALKTDLTQDGNTEDEVNAEPVTEHFLIRLVTELRAAQKAAVCNAVLEGPAVSEEITAWMNRIDVAADIGHELDLASAMDERELRLNLKRLHAWLHGNSHVTASDRLAWWTATQAVHKTLTDLPLPPDPVTLATPEALEDRTRQLLADVIKAKYPPVDPEDVSLSIRKTVVDPHAPTGGSPFGSGVSQGSVMRIVDDCRSLTQWAMSNLTRDERNAPHPTVEGPLSFAQIVEVIERANIGALLPAELQRVARERQAQWMALKAQQMRAQVWAAHISGDLRQDRDNTGLKLVLAALDGPTAAVRGKVNGHEVVVRQLQWGDSVLKELLAFGVKMTASRPSLTLYTPGAPDGKTFRDVDAASARALELTLAQTLTATSQMTRWLISHLPLLEQAEQLASLVVASEELTPDEKIKQVTQSVFARAKDRAQDDFAKTISSPVVEGDVFKALHETQITHGIKTVDMLTVTNAERDSASAQEGRRSAVMLLTGAMSMFPAGRLGGLLGRAILPTMAAGAAVSAIDSEGGSLHQWTHDFIGGLGDVLAEAGQDLIMARAGRHRGQARPALSALPRMPDPDLEPFVLKGFDGKGLVPEGRSRYSDASGQDYLKLGEGYYKTQVQAGERIIYAPNNRTHQRTVTWQNGQWKIEEPLRLLGGGPAYSLLGWTAETPRQKTINALVEGVLVKNRYRYGDTVNTAKRIFNSMPDELAERILRESMAETGVPDIEAYRSRIYDLTQDPTSLAHHQTAHNNLLDKMNTWSVVLLSSKDIETNVSGVHLTDPQKIKIYDTVLTNKKEFFSDDRIHVNTAVITDNVTGAVFMAYTANQGKKKTAIEKIARETREMIEAAETTMNAKALKLFPGNAPETVTARRTYIASVEYHNELVEALRQEKIRRHKPGLLTEIRNHRIPYFIANKGQTQRSMTLVTGEDINKFTNTLSYYEPFDIEIVTQARTNKVTGTQPAPPSPVLPEPTLARDKFEADTSPLAETQMSYANFPETARAKTMEIMDNIRAGRVTTKKINQYYWYDMAQLSPGSGRGAWRAAFERQGDTWTLQGFYDYHVNKPATVWGG
ncbi:dermonecrotic toxin domain-containing protein [Pseudomonas marvdashtae]|uniref:dermonecrotic toxin domain-containing protein n=1 Tax=Pseudomonas marvdashtae TaxID=2745500 RepID=UPI003461FA3B